MLRSGRVSPDYPEAGTAHASSTARRDREAAPCPAKGKQERRRDIKVTCSDGATGIFDMSRYIDRGMFKPLKDPQTFDRVRLAFGVPSWPGDIDIAAERVRSDMQII